MPSAESITMPVDETQETKKHRVKKTVAKTALWAAGIAAVTAPFAISQVAPDKAKAVAISTPAQTPEFKSAVLNPEDFVQGLQVADAENSVKAAINYAAAVDFANKKAFEDLLTAQAAADAAQATQPHQPVYGGQAPNDFLTCVRNRESGGDYGVYNSGGSGAAGAYQFMPGTWNSIATSVGRMDLVGVDPAQASPADQDAMAADLYAQQGAGPWGGGCN